MTTQFAIKAVDVDLPKIGQHRLVFANSADTESRCTILVGRNGTGKSTILRELAMAFRAYFATARLSSRQGRDRVSQIAISIDNTGALLNLRTSAKDFQEERDDMIAKGLRPRRLIALSFTPFDKFPPADDTNRHDRPFEEDPFYVYLGFKSDVRNLTPRGRLLRSIEQLAFAQATPQADARVVEAFAVVGYAPVLTVTYALTPRGNRDNPEITDTRLLTMIEDIRDHGRSRGGKRNHLSYTVDFRVGRRDIDVPLPFDDIRELVHRRILRLTGVSFDQLDGEAVELLELSSGELNLLSGFLGLAAFLEDGCLVLIDEPENSLHPEWQLRYVAMLETVLKQHKGCHYVIATHSPLIVSGVAGRNSKVLRLDQEPVELSVDEIANTSPDATLITAFEVLTPDNNFLKQLVLEAMGLIQSGQYQSERALRIANFLAAYFEKLRLDDPLRNLVAGIVQTILPQP